MAIVDSVNRNLRAGGFVEDDRNPDFKRLPTRREGNPKPMSARNDPCTLQTRSGSITGVISV